jgi:hypothetical protein
MQNRTARQKSCLLVRLGHGLPRRRAPENRQRMNPIITIAVRNAKEVALITESECRKLSKAELVDLTHECDELLSTSAGTEHMAVQIVNAVATAILRKK